MAFFYMWADDGDDNIAAINYRAQRSPEEKSKKREGVDLASSDDQRIYASPSSSSSSSSSSPRSFAKNLPAHCEEGGMVEEREGGREGGRPRICIPAARGKGEKMWAPLPPPPIRKPQKKRGKQDLCGRQSRGIYRLGERRKSRDKKKPHQRGKGRL